MWCRHADAVRPVTSFRGERGRKLCLGSYYCGDKKKILLIMLNTRKLSWLNHLGHHHPWVFYQVRLPLSYCKLNYIIQRYKSSKVVKSIQQAKKIAIVKPMTKNVDKVINKVVKKPQKDYNLSRILRKNSSVQVEKKFPESPIETETQTAFKQENDIVPKIEITSVNEVIEKVIGKLYHKSHGLSSSQETASSFDKYTGKVDHGIEKAHKVKVIKNNKVDNDKIMGASKKKIFFFDKKINIEQDDSLDYDKYHHEGNHISKNTNGSLSDEEVRLSVLKQDAHASSGNNMDININHDKTEALQNIRRNALGIQMLPKGIFDQLFEEVSEKDSQKAEDLDGAKEHLQAHGLWDKTTSFMAEVDFKLPKLESKDLDQHFRVIAEDQCFHYKELLKKLIGEDLPSPPSQWEFTPGWTRYNVDGSCSPVDYPECSAIVFDVEVCIKEGSHPTLATAVSSKYWYSWCSEVLTSTVQPIDRNEISMKVLIPLESSKEVTLTDAHLPKSPRLVVGHNVSYDRLRVREQYLLKETGLRFVDTMSLHIAVSGLVSEQRALLMKNKNEPKIRLPWMSVGCQNSLNDVYKFYCRPEKSLEKSTRDVFVDGSLNDIREDFQNLMAYCASDVSATHQVLVKLLPLFFERFPHPVTFSGMLEMGLTFLPVTKNWERYIESSEYQYKQVERMLNEELVKQVQASLSYLKGEEYKNDPWLWSLDWSQPKAKVKKLPGYPNWYRKLCARTGEREGTPEPENMSTSLQIVPKILKLTWDGFPLHYERKFGWGYLKPNYQSFKDIPHFEWDSYPLDANDGPVFPVKVFYDVFGVKTQDLNVSEVTVCDESTDDWAQYYDELNCVREDSRKRKRGKTDEDENLKNIGIPGVGFIPLPHKDGAGCRVGNPLAKDFLSKIEDNTLTSHVGDVAKLVLETSKSLSYWKNNRDRILSQMVVWSNHSSLPHAVTSSDGYTRDSKYGVILPMVISAGTITRRAVERTWMTASNAYSDRIGSELKAMVEAPPGYKFVGADVDSQELWIAALLGDAYFTGEHGATALGWMTLQGKKSDGTDMHSHTAQSAGISRDHAKVINYGRIYGAGLRFIQRLLKQYNPKLTDTETRRKAEHLFAVTKGEKGWYLNDAGENLASELGYHVTEEPMPRKKIMKILREAYENNYEATFSNIVEKPPIWVGGSESHMFNCLEAIARCPEPKTPVLGARITRALEPQYVDDQFMTSRVNWVVQSSAVDYLHIMLVRYLVAEGDCYRAALALQITNLLTRAYFATRLGFKDLPLSVAFFSGVDIDQVLRKEPHLDCVTPSNPQGLIKGYNIKPGTTLDMNAIMDKTNGELAKLDFECYEEIIKTE
ncbi:DNA polymerase subunit gamma-1-like isoform X3 [Portunus trituberculatus]|uniref:DNA polymerase subunit gamma-1-like isoform X3 n=1 Tax=Portunus trituberculatus TaxID=210409 RepID=UPI001E1CC5AD|nr:DNA polymerase subunit gamma-1-like isoform X3 [Portunus trituberculatus]